ncbi:hypothetical protein [Acidithiobacillus caldus]|uniref:hypothetical protein n=1 Tax=Acidithiobacillus caldus TaxID=33059 RepID=UPI00129C07A8|nr:hypothetical protein [Acidithiobacillus caldus]MBU2729606.1 hypothetical protein [Acidithiobacillus caldus]MBU2734253.1 hypothetical protein [Acidithiobacillus caldus ATCC 51756]MBU2746099.1 hypothetical protein [Acidithiobacillus caldus]MBU2764099.1 hypothetical protein [Acidithiobacillus caldus]MBU2772102.1 hypothetical protein [Acidithiobacillus caldus]
MKTALHPYNVKKEVTVQTYTAEFGPKLDPQSRHQNRPRARCPGCLEPMIVVGNDRPLHDQIFSHPRDANPPPCPLRNRADHKYVFLHDVPVDTARGRALRADFFEHWQTHYAHMRKLLNGYMDVDDFIAVIKEADHSRLWSRGNLQEWEVPYIFLAWKEWAPVIKKKGQLLRPVWLRFWFDSRVRTLDDIWIRTQGDPRIIKAIYRNPARGGSPTLRHLVDTKTLYIDQAFLQAQYRPPVDYVVLKMRQAFPRDFP